MKWFVKRSLYMSTIVVLAIIGYMIFTRSYIQYLINENGINYPINAEVITENNYKNISYDRINVGIRNILSPPSPWVIVREKLHFINDSIAIVEEKEIGVIDYFLPISSLLNSMGMGSLKREKYVLRNDTLFLTETDGDLVFRKYFIFKYENDSLIYGNYKYKSRKIPQGRN